MAAITWIGTTDGNWNTSTNWDLGRVPQAGDDVHIAGTTNMTQNNDIAAATSYNSLTFDAGCGAVTLTGNSITLAGNLTDSSSNNQSIGIDIILNVATCTVSVNQQITISGIISETGGARALTKTGTGTLIVTAANSYTGATTVSAGTLQIGNGSTTGSLSTSSAITVTSPGILSINRSNAVALGTDCAATIAGTGFVQQSGAGTLAMNSNNGFSGGFNINGAGVVTATVSNNALGLGTITFNTAAVRLVITDGLTISNPIVMNACAGAVDRGLIENSSTASATLQTGAVTINGLPTNGEHFSGATGGTLVVANVITSASTVVQVRGGVTLSGDGAGYANLSIRTGTVKVGATNGIASTATVDLGSVGSATLDLNGFSQSLAGLTKNTNAAVVGNSSTANNVTLTLTGTSSFAGVIQNTLGSGNKVVALTINGSSKTTTFSGANTYTGTTTVTDGTLKSGVASVANTSGAFGNNSPLVMANAAGAILDITGFDTQIGSLTGGGTGGNVTLAAATLTVGGDNSSPAAYAGVISSSGSPTTSLVKIGSGALLLSGVNSYTGATTVSAGTLLVNGSLNISSAVTVANTGFLGGNGTVYGTVAVSSGGTLVPGAATGVSIGILTTGAVTFASGSFYSVDLNGTTPTFDQINSTGAVNLGSATLTIANIASAAAGKLYTIVNAASVSNTFTGYGHGSVFTQATRTFQILYNAATVTLRDVTGVGPSTQVWDGGGGDNKWTTAQNWVGDVTPLPGDSLTFTGSVGLTPTNDFVADTSFNNILFSTTSSTFALGGNRIILTGGINNSSGVPQTFAVPAALSSGTHTVNASYVLEVTGILSGTGGITTTGTAQLYIGNSAADNTYAGDTIVNGSLLKKSYNYVAFGTGTVTVNSGNELETIGSAITNTIISNSGVLRGSFSGGITSNTLVTFKPRNTPDVVSGIITGTGGMTVNCASGSNILRLTAANNYSGATTVLNGTLSLGNGGVTGSLATSSAITVTSPGVLSFYRSDTLTGGTDFNSVVGGTGAVVQEGTGTTIFTATQTYSGTTSVTAGTLQIGNGSTTGSLATTSAITVTSPGTFAFKRSNTVTMGTDCASVITGSGGVTQAGSGTWVFLGTQTYTGPTTISAGTLQIGSGGTLGKLSTSSSIVNNSILVFNYTGTLTQGTDFALVISGTGAIQHAGTGGTLRLTGSNTYTGKTSTTAAGILQFNTFLPVAGVAGAFGAPTGANGTIDLVNGSTLKSNTAQNNTYNPTDRKINLISNGAGSVTISFNDNDTGIGFGGVTATGTGAKTLFLRVGEANGDRDWMVFTGPITDTANAALSLDVRFGAANSGGGTLFLSAVNTFTGGLTISYPGNGGTSTVPCLVYVGATPSGNTRTPVTGTGQLNSGDYSGDISLGACTSLIYQSTAGQILRGIISGGGSYQVGGTGYGGLTCVGVSSVLQLTGTDTYTGATKVTSGSLIVTGSLAAASAVSVASGATLGGTGTINGTITAASGGIVAPGLTGTAIGQLNVVNATLQSGSTYRVDLDGATPTFDKLNSAAGTITLAGTLTVANITGSATGKIYTIIGAATVSGTFNGLAENATVVVSGRTLRVNYTATTATLTDVTSSGRTTGLLAFFR